MNSKEFTQMAAGDVIEAELRCIDGFLKPKETYVHVQVRDEGQADKLFCHWPDGRGVYLHALERHGESLIADLSGLSSSCVCFVTYLKPERVQVRCHVFRQVHLFSEQDPLVIYLDPALTLPGPVAADRTTFLTDQMQFDGSVISVARRGKEARFRLVSSKFTCDIERQGAFYECTKISRYERKHIDGKPLTLLRGPIRFTQDREPARGHRDLDEQYLQHTNQDSEWLNWWRQFNAAEKVALNLRLRELGHVEYRGFQLERTERSIIYSFNLTSQVPSHWHTEDLEIEAASTPPDVQADGEVVLPPDNMRLGSCSIKGRQLRVELDLDEDVGAKPPKRGCLYPSSRATTVSTRRRHDALTRLTSNSAPMLGMLALLDGGIATAPATVRRWPSLKRTTDGVNLTETQLQAVNLAISTPDIALIQGPPGTGKTSVLRELLKHLTKPNKTYSAPRILIASSQHSAVDNVIGGLDLGGLPSKRIGSPRNTTPEYRLRRLLEWSQERKAHCLGILKEFARPSLWALQTEIRLLIEQFENARGQRDGQLNVLREIMNRCRSFLPTSLLESMVRAQHELAAPSNDPPADEDPLTQQCRALMRAQRLHAISFLDDGPQQLAKLMRFLHRNGPHVGLEIDETLATLADIETVAEREAEACVKRLRQAIEDMAVRMGGGTAPSVLMEMPRLFRELTLVIDNLQADEHEQKRLCIEEFIDSLDDTQALTRILDEYAGVAAGTCQQVAPRSTRLLEEPYDIVIIDEAARANPLDLLIPMTMGRKVILVGDHKQLPHMLEPEVVELYSAQHGPEQAEKLKTSLFQRLYVQLEEKHQEGQAKRTILLRDDFRMARQISEFVSTTFYDGKVNPARLSTSTGENAYLALYNNKRTVWLDVPASQGRETPGQSKKRHAEIEPVVQEVQKVLMASASATVGVITFYAQQASELRRQMESFTTEDGKRVEVGTVDAFQGREYDVVFLSTVRSNALRRPDERRSRIGFIDDTARLCVAFSRARDLLVVVGDSQTVAGADSEPCIKEFYAWLSLCRTQGCYRVYAPQPSAGDRATKPSGSAPQ